MNVLITGATGLVGRHLARRLLERGDTLVVLSRNSTNVERALGFPCEAFNWDPEREEPPASAFQGVEAVVHLAGEPVASGRWTAERKRRIEDSRALGTANLVAAIRKLTPKPSILVSASAIGFYGNRGDEWLDESSSPGQDFLAGVCERWEGPTRGLDGLRVVNPRIGLVLEPHDGMLSRVLPIFRKGVAGRIGSGRQWMSWIHIEDAVSALIECLTNSSLSGPVNLVSPNPVTNQEFTKQLSAILGLPALIPVPALVLRVALGELSEALLGGQRVCPKKLEEIGFVFRHGALEPALKELLS